VRNQTICMALNVKPPQSQIQLRWFGHVARMPESRYPCMAWEAQYDGRRMRGRPWTNGRTSKMHCSRREWTGDRPDHGHKTERYGMLFAKLLHLMVEEVQLSEVNQHN
jgi:hypothetical protein